MLIITTAILSRVRPWKGVTSVPSGGVKNIFLGVDRGRYGKGFPFLERRLTDGSRSERRRPSVFHPQSEPTYAPRRGRAALSTLLDSARDFFPLRCPSL